MKHQLPGYNGCFSKIQFVLYNIELILQIALAGGTKPLWTELKTPLASLLSRLL